MKKLVLFVMLFALLSCAKKEEKKDDFLGTPEPKKVEQPSRINVIEGGGWSTFMIVEVDGHLYLCNSAHGGIVHLESCPCKTK